MAALDLVIRPPAPRPDRVKVATVVFQRNKILSTVVERKNRSISILYLRFCLA